MGGGRILEAPRPAPGAWLALRLIGSSPALRSARARLLRLSRERRPVLIAGEKGSGRECAIRALHALSPMRARPLLVARGRGRPRVFWAPRGAAVFIADVDCLTQVEWSRWRDQWGARGTGRRLARLYLSAPARSASPARRFDLVSEIVATLEPGLVELPPLRERLSDLPQLMARFLSDWAARLGQPVAALEPAALARLRAYEWPGNLSELALVSGELAARARAGVIRSDLVDELLCPHAEPPDRFLELRVEIHAALEASGGNLAAAARRLDLCRSTLVARARDCGLLRVAGGPRQRGKAAATPPSTGSVAPVVGVSPLAKKTTALPT